MMNTNYKKQIWYNSVGNVVYLICQWLLTVITTRATGVDDAGVIALAMSVGNIFFFIQAWGMRSYQVSDVSGQFAAKQYVYSRYTSSAAGVFLCICFLLITNYSMDKKCAILLFLLYRTFEAVSDAYFGELQKIGRLDILAKSMSVKGIASVLIFWAVIKHTYSLLIALLAIVVLSLLITVIYDRTRFGRFVEVSKEKLTVKEIISPLKVCLSLFISSILPIVVTSYPRIVLDRIYGSELLGYYGNVSAPTTIITAVIPSALVSVMTLYASWICDKEYKKLLRGFLASLAVTAAFGAVCALGVFLLGDFVMALVYTENILPYVHYLYPLLLSTTIYAATMCANSLLISLRKNRAVLIFSAAAMCCCILICGTLTEKYGITGVIAATGISYSIQFTGQLIYLAVLMINFKKKSGKE